MDDLESDFFAIYHLDMYALGPARFFRLAERVATYEAGLVYRLMLAEREEKNKLIPGYQSGEQIQMVDSDSPEIAKMLKQI